MKKNQDEMRKQIEMLLEKVGNNITVNNTTNNNIQLNNYGKEDLIISYKLQEKIRGNNKDISQNYSQGWNLISFTYEDSQINY